jgi:hemerythrin-like domain-containing protein
MKRDPNIIPLSRDHHLGLLFCWKIRRGLDLGVEPDRIYPYVVYFWKTHLQEHFQQEEMFLFNTLDAPQCHQALEEHHQIGALIDAISHEKNTSQETLISLTDLLERHIRFEERQLFPLLEASLSPGQLSEIGEKLNKLHDHPAVDDYKDAFWI